jgi:uncharacterized protein YggE
VPGEPRIVVTGEGVAFGVPDLCSISVALNVMRETPAEAVSAVATVADAALRALAEAGVERSDVRTLNLTVRDWFDPGTQQVTGRIGTYALLVTNRRLEDVSRVLDALAAAAGESLQVLGVTLTVADDAPLSATARRMAVEDATLRAHQLAEAAGVRLGPIEEIDETATPSVGGGFAFAAARRGAEATAVPPMPVEAGTASVTVRVTMAFAIDAR